MHSSTHFMVYRCTHHANTVERRVDGWWDEPTGMTVQGIRIQERGSRVGGVRGYLNAPVKKRLQRPEEKHHDGGVVGDAGVSGGGQGRGGA